MNCYWVNVYSKNGKITYGGLWLSEAEARNAPRSIEPVYRIKVRFKAGLAAKLITNYYGRSEYIVDRAS